MAVKPSRGLLRLRAAVGAAASALSARPVVRKEAAAAATPPTRIVRLRTAASRTSEKRGLSDGLETMSSSTCDMSRRVTIDRTHHSKAELNFRERGTASGRRSWLMELGKLTLPRLITGNVYLHDDASSLKQRTLVCIENCVTRTHRQTRPIPPLRWSIVTVVVDAGEPPEPATALHHAIARMIAGCCGHSALKSREYEAEAGVSRRKRSSGPGDAYRSRLSWSPTPSSRPVKGSGAAGRSLPTRRPR